MTPGILVEHSGGLFLYYKQRLEGKCDCTLSEVDMVNWKVLFRPHILERGLNYYEMGAVENVQKTETGLCAAVVGNKNNGWKSL